MSNDLFPVWMDRLHNRIQSSLDQSGDIRYDLDVVCPFIDPVEQKLVCLVCLVCTRALRLRTKRHATVHAPGCGGGEPTCVDVRESLFSNSNGQIAMSRAVVTPHWAGCSDILD